MDTELTDYLRATVGRAVAREELAIAIGVSVSTIDRRKGEGFSLDETLRILDYFDLSRTAALVSFGVLQLEDVMDQVDAEGALVANTSTAALAAEVAARLTGGGGETGPASGTFPGEDVTGVASQPTRSRKRSNSTRTRQGILE